MEDIDYTKYGWVDPKASASAPSSKSEDIDYAKYGYVPPPEQEKFSTSWAMAPFRVTKDVYDSALSGIRNIPNRINQAETEVPGLYQSFTQHPGHVAKQFGAGLTQLGHNLLNTLHNSAEYTSDRLHLLPKAVADAVPQQKDISNQINDFYGASQYPGENLARGIGEHLLDIGGAGKVASTLNPMKLTSGNIAKSVVNAEKENKAKYSG